MRNIENIYILGGAGYLGLFLIHKLQKEYPQSMISVITQNTTKEIFFRFPNVKVIKTAENVKGENLKIINLAYSLGDYYSDTKCKNQAILKQIKLLVKHNSVKSIIHVSSIVLSNQSGNELKLSRILKNDIYYYAKSYIEQELYSFVSREKIPLIILRSGNIMGPGSPWVVKIVERLYQGLPLIGLKGQYPSNTTFVGNLTYAIMYLAKQKLNNETQIMNFCEFGELPWKTWIDKLNQGYNYPVNKWSVSALQEVKPNLKNDMSNLKKIITKDVILTLFKGRFTNNLIVKLIDTFGLRKLKSKSKSKVRNNVAINKEYIDLSEYNNARVFLNDKAQMLENVPRELIESIPFSFEDSLSAINNWKEMSGYHFLKNDQDAHIVSYNKSI